jgi:hypothetical protein
MLGISPEHTAQMGRVEDETPVETFAPDGADQPLDMAAPRGLRSGGENGDRRRLYPCLSRANALTSNEIAEINPTGLRLA